MQTSKPTLRKSPKSQTPKSPQAKSMATRSAYHSNLRPGQQPSLVRKIVLASLFTATTIILARFLSIRTPVISIGFSTVAIMLSGILLGWKYSTLIALIADLIGAVLFPSGPFFLGYTLTAVLTGLVSGWLLYLPGEIRVTRQFTVRLVICTLIICLVLNGVLNTVWIVWTTGDASKILVPMRFVKQILAIPIYIATILALVRGFQTQFNQLVRPAKQKFLAEIEDSDGSAI